MKTILLMTDFSDSAKNAIKYAIDMFGESVEYVLLNTYVVRENSGSFMSLADRVMEISEEEMEKELAFIHAEFPQYPNLKIEKILKRGGPIDGVKTLNQNGLIDLIIMGTKGASGLTKILVGSVTASIVKGTELPVLIIPKEAIYKGITKVVFAADLPNLENKEVLNPLISILQKFNAELCLLNVLQEETPKEEAIQKMEILKNDNSLQDIKTAITAVEGESVSELIEGYCKTNKVDLLTIVAHHNKFFDRLFHKSISQELVFHAQLPILALDDSFNS